MGFLVVGHIHEDIDKSFGYLSKNLTKQNNYALVDLMKTFMEIPDFKSWVQGYMKDGPMVLVKHMNTHLFLFFVDFSRWLVMQYKVSPTNAMWSLKDGATIGLWKFDDKGCLKLLSGVLKVIQFHPVLG